jgi:hypothetical protein
MASGHERRACLSVTTCRARSGSCGGRFCSQGPDEHDRRGKTESMDPGGLQQQWHRFAPSRRCERGSP